MLDSQTRAAEDAPDKREPAGAPGQEPALRGTFASVMLLGAFIAVTWIGVFALFVHRN